MLRIYYKRASSLARTSPEKGTMRFVCGYISYAMDYRIKIYFMNGKVKINWILVLIRTIPVPYYIMAWR